MMTLLQQSQRWPLKSIQVRLLFSDRFYLIQFFTEFPKNVKGRMKNLEFLGRDKQTILLIKLHEFGRQLMALNPSLS